MKAVSGTWNFSGHQATLAHGCDSEAQPEHGCEFAPVAAKYRLYIEILRVPCRHNVGTRSRRTVGSIRSKQPERQLNFKKILPVKCCVFSHHNRSNAFRKKPLSSHPPAQPYPPYTPQKGVHYALGHTYAHCFFYRQ